MSVNVNVSVVISADYLCKSVLKAFELNTRDEKRSEIKKDFQLNVWLYWEKLPSCK